MLGLGQNSVIDLLSPCSCIMWRNFLWQRLYQLLRANNLEKYAFLTQTPQSNAPITRNKFRACTTLSLSSTSMQHYKMLVSR